MRIRWLAFAVLMTLCGVATTQDVSVSGSNIRFAATAKCTVGAPEDLVLTGTALRKKLVFNVYAIGSYVRKGASVRSAEELAAADTVKQLQLVIEREMSGSTLAEALASAIRQNHPAPAFDGEVRALTAKLQSVGVRPRDRLFLTHIPGSGFYAHLNGQQQVFIDNPRFSQAIWDIYLGRNNLGDAIKTGLVSRL